MTRRMDPFRSGSPPPWVRAGLAQLLALALVGAATLCRLWLGQRFADLPAFALYYPVILVAGLTGGWPCGVSALAASAAIGWRGFLPHELSAASETVSVLLFLFSGLFMAFAGSHLRGLVASQRESHRRLAERELRYRTLFDAVSEGFALVEPVRAADGRLVDYTVVEANPAMLRIVGADASVIGRRESEVLRNAPPTWLEACERALQGDPLTFEYHAPGSQRWFEIHLSRVADDKLAQFVMEITDRKTAEARQSELFDELNHRVKNNLAIVSAMLSLQARDAEPKVRAQLSKAVGRIQAMADVHASLYRSSRKDDVDFAVYLDDLCQRLSGSLLEDDRVRIDLVAEPAVMPLDRAVALGLIVNELVTNAAKYAYPAPAAGVIAVKLERAAHALVLTVADRGRGFASDDSKAGLGMRLVRSLAQQIGATLEVERSPGVCVRVRLPDVAPVSFEPAGQGRLL